MADKDTYREYWDRVESLADEYKSEVDKHREYADRANRWLDTPTNDDYDRADRWLEAKIDGCKWMYYPLSLETLIYTQHKNARGQWQLRALSRAVGRDYVRNMAYEAMLEDVDGALVQNFKRRSFRDHMRMIKKPVAVKKS